MCRPLECLTIVAHWEDRLPAILQTLHVPRLWFMPFEQAGSWRIFFKSSRGGCPAIVLLLSGLWRLSGEAERGSGIGLKRVRIHP